MVLVESYEYECPIHEALVFEEWFHKALRKCTRRCDTRVVAVVRLVWMEL